VISIKLARDKPVELGKVLFQVARRSMLTGSFLQVEERDIAYVAVGQRGQLTLSGIPDQLMDFTLTADYAGFDPRRTGATSSGSRHIFSMRPKRVRPGMEGLGKGRNRRA